MGAPIANTRVLPAIEGYLNAAAAAKAADRDTPAFAPIVVLEEPPPSFRLLAHRNLVLRSAGPGSWASLRASDGYVYVAFRPSREPEVAAPSGRATGVGDPLQILARTPSLVLARVKPRPEPARP